MEYQAYNSDRSLRHPRKSLRLSTHNYQWTGTYFITICVKEPEITFEHPTLKSILTETWQALPQRFPNVTLDAFVAMPDHVHFILKIEGNVAKPTTLSTVVGAYKSLTTVAWIGSPAKLMMLV